MRHRIVSTMQRQFRPVLISVLLVTMLLVVLPNVLPRTLAQFFPGAPRPALAGSNPIVTENAQPGSTGWQFDTDSNGNPLQASNHEIEGYASVTSVNQGGQISFMVSLSSSAQYTMAIYRMGYYPNGTNPDGSPCVGPCGGRLMQTLGPLSGAKQATCPTTTTTTNFGLTECKWPVAYTLTVPTSWTTGIYLVKLRRLDSGLEQYMTFVVRSDSGQADIVLSEDVTTWQAYNYWGGAGNNDVGYDLYGQFNDSGLGTSTSSTRAHAVSFDRPYLDEGEVDGAGEFMLWDYPMVRWIESQGYNVTYATDVDLETNPNLLNGRKALINSGHDEYYSANMRSNLQGFINAGVNVGFFSANNIYYQIRWANSSSGQADRIVICYKDASLDPTTVRWRDLSPPQPENAVVGVMQNGVANDRPYEVYDATSWIYAGTGLVNYTGGNPVTSGSGQNAIKGIIGYEFDERADNDSSLSSYVSFDPAGLHQVGHSNVPASDNGVAAFSDATLYTASSGAIVFAAGTLQWAWGLDNGYNDGFCNCNPGYVNSASQKITANILNTFISGSTTQGPAVSLSPSSLSFGNQQVNTTSAALNITLTNSGNAALSISSIGLTGTNSGDFAQTNTCPSGSNTLAAGATCTISVTFTPSATGTRSASVSISDNASGSPQAVALSGTGSSTPAPAVSLSPTSLSFGNQNVGTTSAAQTVTLTNSGTGALTITSIGLTGTNAGDFAQSNTCPSSSSTLTPGATCTISVTFTPSATGTRSASVSITDNASGSPQAVALSGTGVTPAPSVSLSPTSLSFGNQNVGTTSAAQSVTLTNSGTAALTISSIGLTGTNASDFAQTNTCPTSPNTLAAGATCTISVTFSPTATGTRSASVSISDNASGSPQSVALSGNAIAAGVYFSDGFESGNFNQWTVPAFTGQASVQSAVVNSGSYAAAFTNASGQYTYIYANLLSGAQTQTYTRFYFRFASLSASTAIAFGRDSNGNTLWEVDYDANRHGIDVYFWNGARTRYDLYSNTNVLSANTWYSIEVQDTETTTGTGQVWLNGTSIGIVNNDLSVAAGGGYARLFLYDEAAGTAYFDDVVVSNTYNGP